MISISGKNWEETYVKKRILEKVKIDNDLPDILAKIVVSRNFDKDEIHSIKNKITFSNPFFKDNDFSLAEQLLNEAIEKKKKIIILGDYDVDGCVSTSFFVNFFKEINYPIKYFIPDRIKDGYGASLELIKRLTKDKPDLFIMVDCGSTSYDSIDFLKRNKIKTLIIDHHEIYRPFPKAEVIINFKKDTNNHYGEYFCASSLSYFFLDYYIKKNGLNINFDKYQSYVLLAIIADVMPLRKINRKLAIKTLENFDFKKDHLFKEIFELKKINRPIEIDDFGFLLAPLINSAGRLGNANDVISLLTSSNKKLSRKLLNNLFILNEKRKKLEDIFLNEINFKKLKENSKNIIIITKNIINEGIIGIIASRLKDYFNKPCIVMTKSGSLYKASARSTIEFNLGRFIKQAIDNKIVINGGGHNLAAGFSIKQNQIQKFDEFINSNYIKIKTKNDMKFLSKISLNAVNKQFYDNLKKIGPFGSQNINPIFLIENLKIFKVKIIKKKYVSFFVKSRTGKILKAISFNILESDITQNLINSKNEMNLIIQIKENLWNNKKSLQLIVLDLIMLPNSA
jgi:single-stranded-DNA-specific exonuclease